MPQHSQVGLGVGKVNVAAADFELRALRVLGLLASAVRESGSAGAVWDATIQRDLVKALNACA